MFGKFIARTLVPLVTFYRATPVGAIHSFIHFEYNIYLSIETLTLTHPIDSIEFGIWLKDFREFEK